MAKFHFFPDFSLLDTWWVNCNGNCRFVSVPGMTIKNDAVLTLGTGMDLRTGWYSYGRLNIGDGITGGTLATVPAAVNPSEWPLIRSLAGRWNHGINFFGAPGSPAIAVLNGLRTSTKHSANDPLFNFSDYFDIQQFDNLVMSLDTTTDVNIPYVRVQTCENAFISDLSWSGLAFVHAITGSGANVSIANCGSLGVGAIAISSLEDFDDAGFGGDFASDPDGVLDWIPSL